MSVLAEEFVSGREFTVGLLGNGADLRVFPPMEIVFQEPTEGTHTVYSYPVKQDYTRYVRYECPANLTQEQTNEIVSMARRAFTALSCRDFTRVDFRMAGEAPVFLEINPLPGLSPACGDLPILARGHGLSYEGLMGRILDVGLKRSGLK